MNLIPKNKWITVRTRDELPIDNAETGDCICETNRFEVSLLDHGCSTNVLLIRPVIPYDENCDIEECETVEFNIPMEKLDVVSGNLPTIIFNLWNDENGIFDQDPAKVKMVPGTRPDTYFPKGYIGFKKDKDTPMYIFKKTIFAKFVRWDELKRIVNEIYDTDVIICDRYGRDGRIPDVVPEGCIIYKNCVAGDKIEETYEMTEDIAIQEF